MAILKSHSFVGQSTSVNFSSVPIEKCLAISRISLTSPMNLTSYCPIIHSSLPLFSFYVRSEKGWTSWAKPKMTACNFWHKSEFDQNYPGSMSRI